MSNELIDCSFCNKELPAAALVRSGARPEVHICFECVGLCLDIMREKDRELFERIVTGSGGLRIV